MDRGQNYLKTPPILHCQGKMICASMVKPLWGGFIRAQTEKPKGVTMPVRPQRFNAEAVRELWDTAAGAYAEGQASGRDYYRLAFFGPAHIALCGDVQGRRILDVGCGTGYFAREMARRGARVTGVDISPQMLAHAVQAESQAPLGIRYLVHDAAHLLDRFVPESFDM